MLFVSSFMPLFSTLMQIAVRVLQAKFLKIRPPWTCSHLKFNRQLPLNCCIFIIFIWQKLYFHKIFKIFSDRKIVQWKISIFGPIKNHRLRALQPNLIWGYMFRKDGGVLSKWSPKYTCSFKLWIHLPGILQKYLYHHFQYTIWQLQSKIEHVFVHLA